MNMSMQTIGALWHRSWPQLAKLYLLVVGVGALATTVPRLYRTLYLGEPTTLANYGSDMYILAASIAILFMLVRLCRA